MIIAFSYFLAFAVIASLVLFIFFLIFPVRKIHGFFTMKKFHAGKYLIFRHVYGLPVSQFLLCYMYITKAEYILECDKKIFRLKRSNIVDKDILTDMDVSSQVVGTSRINSATVKVESIKRILHLVYTDDDGNEKTLGLDFHDFCKDDDIKYYFKVKSKSETML